MTSAALHGSGEERRQTVVPVWTARRNTILAWHAEAVLYKATDRDGIVTNVTWMPNLHYCSFCVGCNEVASEVDGYQADEAALNRNK